MLKDLRLGLDFGGTQVKVALVSRAGSVQRLGSVDTVRDPRQLVAAIQEAVKGWPLQKVRGTGVGVAGDVDSDRGVVRYSPNLGWTEVPLRSLLERADLPRPLRVENDANAAAWGAFRTEMPKAVRHLVVLTLGTGVGGGLIIDRKLYRGASGSAGEVGHMVIDPQGPKCGCGNRGCPEAYLGAKALIKRASELTKVQGRHGPKWETPLDLEKAALAGHAVARQVWTEAGRALGLALANVLNLFNPDAVLLCGGLAGAAPLILKEAQVEVNRRAFATPRRQARTLVSKKNRHLGVVGAALLVD